MLLNSKDAWVIYTSIENSIKAKINKIGTPLKEWDISINFGIKTGYNSAFIISTAKKNELIEIDPKSADLIRPILRGRDIQRYTFSSPNLWIINVHNGLKNEGIAPIHIEDYPAIKQHLDLYFDKLTKRADKGITPYNLRNCAYMNDFSMQKIVWKRIGSKIRFSYDANGYYCLDSTCFATGKGIKYLVAILNSSMGNYLLREAPKTGTGDLIISVQALEPLRIPIISNNQQKSFEYMIDSIISCIEKHLDYYDYEKKLDDMVFNLYDLSNEERRFVTQTVQSQYR